MKRRELVCDLCSSTCGQFGERNDNRFSIGRSYFHFVLFVFGVFFQIAVGNRFNPDQVNQTWHAFWAASDFLVI